MNTRNKEEAVTLEILETIDNQSDLTQRHLANRLGVALGLANSYLKRCVRKGLIKIEQAPANRYLYYLTPHGFAEKSRLTAEFLSVSFDFYRRAGISCTQVFEQCRQHDFQRVLLCGISELAEIASLRAKEQGIKVVGILDRDSRAKEAIGIPVWTSLHDAGEFDACVITAIDNPTEILAHITKNVNKDRVFIPEILGIK